MFQLIKVIKWWFGVLVYSRTLYKESILPASQGMKEFSAGEAISITGEAKFLLLTKFGLISDTFYHFTNAENYNWNQARKNSHHSQGDEVGWTNQSSLLLLLVGIIVHIKAIMWMANFSWDIVSGKKTKCKIVCTTVEIHFKERLFCVLLLLMVS